MALPFGIDVFSFIPALGAVALSLKNWLQLRQGAVLQPIKIMNFGLWGINAGEKKNKVLLLPIMVANEGSKTGMITRVKIEFDGKNLEILRKVIVESKSEQQLRNLGVHEFRLKSLEDINPFYPININSRENESFVVECFDKDNIIPVNSSSTCKITIEFGNNKSSTIEFPFKISQEDYDKSCEQLIWIRNE